MGKQPHCKRCNTTDLSAFYDGTTKSRCKKCIAIEKKMKKTGALTPPLTIDELSNQVQELSGRLETLDEQEVFDDPQGQMTFREMLKDKLITLGQRLDDMDKRIDEIDKRVDAMEEAVIDTIAKHESKYENEVDRVFEYMESLHSRLQRLESLQAIDLPQPVNVRAAEPVVVPVSIPEKTETRVPTRRVVRRDNRR